MPENIVKYTGGGDHLPYLPARDMTLEEWQALPAEQKKAALALKLYELPKKTADSKDGDK